jgi:hypothetical protein
MVDVSTPEMVLGIGHSPTRSNTSNKSPEVFLREGDGKVRVVLPDVEKNDSVYVRISKSAERGEKDMNPPHDKPKPITNPNRPPDFDTPSGGGPPSGRGGG